MDWNTTDRSQARIACLDDEPQALTLLEKALGEYQVAPFTCSERFLQNVSTTPQCILLDIHISDQHISGYDICRQLRQQAATRHTPIIFISANGELESRLEGYAAGGDDFIAKPFDVDELKAKVERALRHQAHSTDLESAVDNARQAAFEAMTHSAEQGEITRFIEQAGACRSASQLLELLVASLKNFGLNSVVANWSGRGEQFVSHQSQARPLETELLKSCRYGRRIIELERRMVVNFEHTSVLIKNSPWQEPERYGRIKDHLCVLMSSVNERLIALQTELKLQQQTLLLQVVGELRDALTQLQQQRDSRLQQASQQVADLDMELREEVILLNLDPDQEQHLQQLVRSHVARLDQCYRSCSNVGEELQPILEGLEQVVEASG